MLEPEVMRHYGREELGVAIPEGGGYIGTLNVYHERASTLFQFAHPLANARIVHCIVGIRGVERSLSQRLTLNRNAFINTHTKTTTGPT